MPAPSIFRLGYFWETKIFLVSVSLDLYTALAKGPHTAHELAASLHLDTDALERLLTALVAMELLTCTEGRYTNTHVAAEGLVKTSPSYMGDLIQLQNAEWSHWGHLEAVIRTGKPVVEGNLFMANSEIAKQTLHVLDRMARRTAPDLARKLDLSSDRTLLDLGGGAGTYSIQFCKSYPKLQVTLFDLPHTIEAASRAIQQEGMHERIRTISGNFNEDEISGQFDTVFLSDMLHYQTADENARLIRRLYAVVAPGGRIVVKDMFVNGNPSWPGWNAIFSIHLMVYTERGRCFYISEAISWLKTAGFFKIDEIERNTILVAHRPHEV